MGLVRILADTNLRDRVTANALEHVRQYDWERVANRLKTVYELAIQNRATAAPRDTSRLAASLVTTDG
jgi:hypothetical protein